MKRWRIPRKCCPVRGCTEPVRIDRIMCLACWRPVDPKLKRANARAYREWKNDRRNLDLIAILRATNNACIESADAARDRAVR